MSQFAVTDGRVAVLSSDILQSNHIQRTIVIGPSLPGNHEGWNFNSGNYLFTTDTK